MSEKPYRVDVTLRHEKASVSRVHLAPGHATERHSHAHPYVVIPHAPATLLKTTYKGGEQAAQETIEHKPGEPYFVAASADGISFTLQNIGDGPMLCDKTFIKG